MKKLTKNDWAILQSFHGPIIDREQIFAALKLRANFSEMRDLLTSLREDDDRVNKFNIILHNFPDSMSYQEKEELYRIFLLEDWHHDHENIVGAFQRRYNKTPKNIEVLLKRMYNLPGFYQHDADIRNPFIRKCIYAIAAQPQPHSIEILSELSNSNDEVIRAYSQYQLEKIEMKKRHL